MAKKNKELFCDYFDNWIKLYKEGAIRKVTMKKYTNTAKYLRQIAPTTRLKDLDRVEYQRIINEFAKDHEKQTVQDFHHQLKSAILDAFDEDIIKKDPTRRVKITGKIPSKKKEKFLSKEELKKLVNSLDINGIINYDYMILLIIKTGIRFSEAAGITPADFDFNKNTLTINKTWDYKNGGGFVYTKNDSSIRRISLDDTVSKQFEIVCKKLDKSKPIFVFNDNIYNSTVNDCLSRHCKKLQITEITIHSLRHTHASVLLGEKVSIASISKRLGHSNMATTQKVYLHVIQELENQDNALINDSLKNL